MKTLVICKIADPGVRKKVFARLKDRGLPLAQGVFECELGHSEFARLRKYLAAFSYGVNDRIVIYNLCAVCQKGRLSFGGACDGQDEESDWVIV